MKYVTTKFLVLREFQEYQEGPSAPSEENCYPAQTQRSIELTRESAPTSLERRPDIPSNLKIIAPSIRLRSPHGRIADFLRCFPRKRPESPNRLH